MLNLSIGFFAGLLVATLLISYGIGITHENEIKKDILFQELIKENNQHKKHQEAKQDMKKEHWA